MFKMTVTESHPTGSEDSRIDMEVSLSEEGRSIVVGVVGAVNSALLAIQNSATNREIRMERLGNAFETFMVDFMQAFKQR